MNTATPHADQAHLFTYHRIDTAPGGLTTARIRVHDQGAPIHSDVFGNFIEHLGEVVYPGLWAQLLLNPTFAPIDPQQQKEPEFWRLGSSTYWRTEMAARAGMGPNGYIHLCPPERIGEPAATFSQRVWPPVHRTRIYTGSVVARLVNRADDSAEKPAHTARLRVTLSAAPETAPVATATLLVSSPNWADLPFRLSLPANALQRGGGAYLSVFLDGDDPVDVDRIELFPADAVGGVDPDVMRRAAEWRIPLMRWPGGNFASGYHWQDGVGRRADRPTRRNAAWGGLESNEFGTDEFLAMCRRLGATPQMTVNAGDGTPESAANWVRYCNAPATDRFGAMRAANGHSAPYDIRLWEVGNELYGDWQIGHTVAGENAKRYVRFRDALLKVDPHLRLIATGKGDEFLAEGMERDRQWNEALLQAAVANGGPPPDYLSLHPLVPLPDALKGQSYAAQFESAMAHTCFLDRTLLPDVERQIRTIVGPTAETRIAITEWGLIVGGERWQEGPNHDTLAGALYNALCLNVMLRHSHSVTLANMTAFMHGGGIKKPGGVVIVDPQYYTQKLFASAGMHRPVGIDLTGPGRDVPQRGHLPAVRDVPDVDLVAAISRDGTRLTISAVNRSLTDTRPIDLRIEQFEASSVHAVRLDAARPDARNSLERPNAVEPHAVRIEPPAPGHALHLSLPPHSFTLITVQRR